MGARQAEQGPRRLLLAGRHCVPDELDGLFEGDGRVPAGVADLEPQCDVGQDVWIGVDRFDGLEGHLHPLDAILFADGATRARLGLLGRGPLVHRN